jgi:hypothetical protein
VAFKTNTVERRQVVWKIPGFERPKHDQSAKQDKAPIVLEDARSKLKEASETNLKEVKAPQKINFYQ